MFLSRRWNLPTKVLSGPKPSEVDGSAPGGLSEEETHVSNRIRVHPAVWLS
jgi:hypothetical protein